MLSALIHTVQQRPPDFVIGDPADPYLRRWWLAPRSENGNVYLHHILKDDDDRALHDHPWDNVTVVLKGSYIEIMPGGSMTRREGDTVERKAADKHRLVVGKGEAWTLFVTGPKTRDWGFWPGGLFVPWQEYCDPRNPGLVRG